MSTRSLVVLKLSLTSLLALVLALPAFADSQIRMVRLSLVEGDVQAVHPMSNKHEKALLNAPITQGMTLKTGEGRAEIEFEDGSTLRMGPQTQVEFTDLSRRDSGALVSAIAVHNGIVYVDCKGDNYVKLSGGALSGSKNDDFSVMVAKNTIRPNGKAHFRVTVGTSKAELGVFSGDVAVQSPSGSLVASKKQSVIFNLDANTSVLAKKLPSDPLDAWDKEQTDYHDRYLVASTRADPGSPYAYGMSDLGYYGDFFNMPGYGLMWQPYFIGAEWNPFMYGAWLGDPCFNGYFWDASCGGYTWVSAYPWGWLPYHYGTWVYLGGRGWAWQPGGYQTFRPVAPVMHAPENFVLPHPPAGIVSGPVFVDRRPPALRTGVNRVAMNELRIRNGSAGLGVPRGAVSNLRGVSQHAERHGFANASFRMPEMSPAVRPGMAPAWAGNPNAYGRPQGMPASRMGQGAPRMAPSAGHPSFQPAPHFGGGAEGGFHPPAGASAGAPRK